MNYLELGFPTSDLEHVRGILEQALDIEMEPHDSLYFGEYYLWKGKYGDKLQLLFNVEMDGEPLEQDHPHLGVLLYASLQDATYEHIHKPLLSIETVQLLSQEAL